MYLRLVLIVLLVLAPGCANQKYFQDSEIVDRVGYSKAADYSAATSIKSYRVTSEYMVDKDGVPVKDWEFGFLGDFCPVVEVGPTLTSGQANMLLTILGSVDSYDLDEAEKCECCYIKAEYGFELSVPQGSRFVFVSLRCRQVYFRGPGGNVLLSLRSTTEGVKDLMGELFPANEE